MGRVFSNLLLLILLNVLIKPFYILGIDAEVQNRVGENAYGVYFALLNFSFLLNILLDAGVTNFNNRAISRNPSRIEKYYPNLLGLKVVLLVLYVVVSFVIAVLLGFGENHWELLPWLLLNQFFVGLILFNRSNLGALQKFGRDSIISVLDRVLMIGIMSYFLWFKKDEVVNIEDFVRAQTVAYGLTCLVSFVSLPRKLFTVKISFERAFLRRVLKSSLPYAVLIAIMMLYNRIDSVMLERMLGDGGYQAGVYAQGFRLFDAANMFAMLFAVILLPVFSDMIKKREPLDHLTSRATRLVLSGAIPLAIICAIYPKDLLILRYNDLTQNSINSFSLLMIGFVGVCITYIYGTLLTAGNKLKNLNRIALLGLMANIALNASLIPEYGSEGAAIATCVTQLATAIAQMFVAKKQFGLMLFRNMILPLSVFAAVTAAIMIVVESRWQLNVIHLLMAYAVFIAVAIATRLIDIKGLLQYKLKKY